MQHEVFHDYRLLSAARSTMAVRIELLQSCSPYCTDPCWKHFLLLWLNFLAVKSQAADTIGFVGCLCQNQHMNGLNKIFFKELQMLLHVKIWKCFPFYLLYLQDPSTLGPSVFHTPQFTMQVFSYQCVVSFQCLVSI